MAGDTASLSITGLNKFFAALNKVDGSFNKELRRAAMEVAQTVTAATVANASGPQARVFAALRAISDRYPTITLPKSASFRRKKKGRAGARASDVFFGAEFGSNRYKQFHRPHAGRRGYVFWPTVRAQHDRIEADYLSAIERVLSGLSGTE